MATFWHFLLCTVCLKSTDFPELKCSQTKIPVNPKCEEDSGKSGEREKKIAFKDYFLEIFFYADWLFLPSCNPESLRLKNKQAIFMSFWGNAYIFIVKLCQSMLQAEKPNFGQYKKKKKYCLFWLFRSNSHSTAVFSICSATCRKTKAVFTPRDN